MRKRRKRKRNGQRQNSAPVRRAALMVRLDHMHEWADHHVSKAESLTNLPRLRYVPAPYRNRARIVQIYAAGIAASEFGETDKPVISITTDETGLMHIHFQARWPSNLMGFMMIPTVNEQPPAQGEGVEKCFIALTAESFTSDRYRDMEEWMWSATDWERMNVWATADWMSFVKEFLAQMLDVPRIGDENDDGLGMLGDPRWMRLFETLNEME